MPKHAASLMRMEFTTMVTRDTIVVNAKTGGKFDVDGVNNYASELP